MNVKTLYPMENIKLEKNKVYKIPGPFGEIVSATYIAETEEAYHFNFDNHGWKDYPGHIFKEDIQKVIDLNNL